MRKFVVMTLIAAIGLGSACAKTRALWPMNITRIGGNDYARCSVDPCNDLRLAKKGPNNPSGTEISIGWNKPPNLSPEGDFVGTLWCFQEIKCTGPCNKEALLSNTNSSTLRMSVQPIHDFTIEGYLNYSSSTPSATNGRILYFAGDRESGAHFLSLRKSSDADDFFTVVLQLRNLTEFNLGSISESELTNQWCHVALVFKYDDSSPSSRWSFYFNGELTGTATYPKFTNSEVVNSFSLGGTDTGNSNGNNIVGSLCYWRVSDEALSPGDFLDFGGVGTAYQPESHDAPTIAYWKLQCLENGMMDCRDYVGDAHLCQRYFELNHDYRNQNISVPTASPSTDSHDNRGAVRFVPYAGTPATSAGFINWSLGSRLTLNKRFSVEGWIKPRFKSPESTSRDMYLLGTLDNMAPAWRGWMLIVSRFSDAEWGFKIWAQDGSGGRGNLTGSTTGTSFAPRYGYSTLEWMKCKIEYIPTPIVGEIDHYAGTWKLYVNDALVGQVDHVKEFDDSYDYSSYTFSSFFLGNTSNYANGAFDGLVDDVKITLEGVDIAYWPLDTNGANMDVDDKIGGYDFGVNRHISVSANSDGPTVTNPDRSLRFDGNPAVSHGSIRMGEMQTAKGYLGFYDPRYRTIITSQTEGWTLEGFVKIDGAFQYDYGILFACCDGQGTGKRPDFSLRIYPDGSVKLYDNNYIGNLANNLMSFSQKIPRGTWTHVALVRDLMTEGDVRKTRYRLYVNGVLDESEYKLALARAPWETVECYLGGVAYYDLHDMTTDIFNLPGSLSNFRLSRGTLGPEDFLCANVPVPAVEEVDNLAFWPFESDGSNINTETAAGRHGYSIYSNETASGSNDRAASKVCDAALPQMNNGSISVAGNGTMSCDYLGNVLSAISREAWSVEGYFRVGETTGGICGSDLTGTNGWVLGYDSTTNAFFVEAGVPGHASLVPKSYFKVMSGFLPNTWHHILLQFSPGYGGATVWTLYVNGKLAGTVFGNWIKQDTQQESGFSFGQGDFDLWRVTTGLLDVADSLYCPLSGLTIIIK